jgi:serine/threonine protein kinase
MHGCVDTAVYVCSAGGGGIALQVDLRLVSSCVISNTFDKDSVLDSLARAGPSTQRGPGKQPPGKLAPERAAPRSRSVAGMRRSSWATGFLKAPGPHSDSMALCCFTKMCGSLVYMAPEVFTGSVYDEKCDVYSLAMAFCELVQGKPMGHVLKLRAYADAYNAAEKVRSRCLAMHLTCRHFHEAV